MVYEQPIQAAFSRTPMFGTAGGWQTQSPFNFGFGADNPLGMALQLGGPMLLSGIMGRNGMVPGQFMPQQNLYDQMRAQAGMIQSQQAASFASQADVRQMQNTIMGVHRMRTGQDNTPQERQQAFKMAGQLSGILPLLSPLLGEDLVDSLHGSRGSATVMANAMHRGMKLGYDPVTGEMSSSGRSSGTISSFLHRNLYGPGADVSQMRGLSAGQSGLLYEEMAQRGLLGPQGGAGSLTQRMGAVASMTLSDAEIGELAERTKRIQDMKKAGKEITEKDYEDARAEVRATHEQIRQQAASGKTFTAADLEKPGAEDMLRANEAQRIAGKLKNMAGAVAAMREIFGDMGRPNAPMREIINGLEALTQGGLSSMSPGQVEQMVRTTHVIAKQTGIGMEGLLGLTAQNAQLGDTLGLDRSLAVSGTQSAALFGNAARAGGRTGGFGGMTPEQATLLGGQLNMTAARSQVANQMNASIRLLKEGVVGADTDAGRLAQALMEGKRTFINAAGQEVSTSMTGEEWMRIMGSSGVNTGVAQQVLRDRYGNQEFGRDYNTADLARREQFKTDLAPKLAAAFEGSLAATLRGRGLDDRDARDIAQRMPELMQNFTAEELKDVNGAMTKRVQQAVSESAQARVRAGGKQPGETDEEFEKRIRDAGSQAVSSLGEQGAREMAIGMVATSNAMIRGNPQLRGYNSLRGMLQMQNQGTLDDADQQRAKIKNITDLQAALGGIGATDPIARVVDIITGYQPGQNMEQAALTALGGIDINNLPAENKKRLLELAKKRGFLEEGGTAAQENEAIRKLLSETGADLSSVAGAAAPPEEGDVARMQGRVGELGGQGAPQVAADSGKPKKVSLGGTLTLIDPNNVLLAGDGEESDLEVANLA